MTAFFLLILAAAVSMLMIPLAVRLAPALGLVDMPDARKVHKAPVPRVGGWGIAIGTLVPLLVLFELDSAAAVLRHRRDCPVPVRTLG